ncbi:MAG: chromate efflux transporter [Pseudomonadales bacterium]|jgi:chromate transporter|nr:chromate efflux transporter [Pseudomonadales bacterium]
MEERTSLIEIFRRFLVLGCTSFGGPAAHLGYFRGEFVERLGWLDEAAYARLVALSQFLPGPGSSQVGFAIGLERRGLAGGLAAFAGFTVPSVMIMLGLAAGASTVAGTVAFDGLVAGLKLLAVVVVADATLGMGRSFCVTRAGAAIAAVTAAALLAAPGPAMQILLLALAGAAGASRSFVLGDALPTDDRAGAVRWLPLGLFAVLLAGVPLLAGAGPVAAIFGDFFTAGALVFGGGHVVLPLLADLVGAELGTETFLTGYAAAQALPGPMFTLATYLGAKFAVPPVTGALVATVAIFLPGFLLVLALREAWHGLAARPRVAGAAAAINAAVVGLLIAALYDPVFVSAVDDGLAAAAVVLGTFVLRRLRPPILVLVLGFGAFGAITGTLVS